MNEAPQINEKNLILNIFKFSAVSIVSAVLSFTVIPIITRVFSPEEYGKINMFFTVGNMMMNVALLGLDGAYIRFFNEPPENTDKKQIFIFPLLVGCLMNIAVTVIVLLINPDYVANFIFGENNIRALIVLSLYVISLIIFRQLNITYRMNQDAKHYNIQNIAQIFINRVLYISVAFFSPTYYSAVLAITMGMVVLSAIYIWKQRKLFYDVNMKLKITAVKELLWFSFPLMPTTLIMWLNNATAKLMLSGLGKYHDVGVLAMATSLANIFSIIPSGFAVYWSSFMYSNYKTQNELIKKVHNCVTLLSVVLVLLIVLSQDVLFIVLGSNYRGSQVFFAMIMLDPIQSLLCETTSYGISIAKKTKYNMIITFVGYIVNLVACYLLIPSFGGLGAAIAIAVSSILILILKTVIGQQLYRSVESMRKTLLSILIITGVCIGNTFYYDQIALRLIVCVAILLVSCFMYRSETSYIKELFLKLLQK
jgi:Membrane protein involved in the export of O-antigen and teichoic acid